MHGSLCKSSKSGHAQAVGKYIPAGYGRRHSLLNVSFMHRPAPLRDSDANVARATRALAFE